MIHLLIALLSATSQAAPADGAWTWTLYEGDSAVVLANEIPDTANLRATLQCEPGSSVTSVTLYGGEPASGMARLAAGDATAVVEASPARGGLRLAVRTDHPAFAAFTTTGRLAVVVGEQRRTVDVASAHLAKLRRFAELCSG